MARTTVSKRKTNTIKAARGKKRRQMKAPSGRFATPVGDLYIGHPVGVFVQASEAKRRLRELFPNIESRWNNGDTPDRFNAMEEMALVALGVKPLTEILFDVPFDEYDYNPNVVWLCKCAGVITSGISTPMNIVKYDIQPGTQGLVIVQDEGPFKKTSSCGLKYERLQATICFRPENYHLALLYNAVLDVLAGGVDYEVKKWDPNADKTAEVAPWVERFPEILRALILGYSKKAGLNAIPGGYDNAYLKTFAVSRVEAKDPSVNHNLIELSLTPEQIQEEFSSFYDEFSVQIAAVKKGFEEST
jgi:hypothetical protein